MSIQGPSRGDACPCGGLTPAGTEQGAVVRRRRLIMLGLNAVSYLLLCAGVARLASAGGWTGNDVVLLVAFMVAAPWSVLGFWNGVVGFALLRAEQPWTAPFLPAAQDTPLAATAVVMTVRNEDPVRALARLRATKASLDRTGHGDAFTWFLLSDTDDAALAAAEEAAFGRWRQAEGASAIRLRYRRRRDNAGFKAGNLRDFCETWGAKYEFMLLLDADSLMGGGAIVDLVRTALAHPRLGIAQTLAVGLPAPSAFTRLFQFGMRHGLRTYMTGAAWWAADCGSYWGHNALVRIAPFVEHCRLPILPGGAPWGGAIMAHDQVEAALMRRAGFEVRVFARETESFEDAPPDLIAHTTRDLRWCQGNLQYWPLLRTSGLLPTSRFQLFWAAMMFYGMPASNLLLVCVAGRALSGGWPVAYPSGVAIAVYIAVLAMGITPKILGFLGIAMTPGATARWGGPLRFWAGCAAELVVSFMVKAITEFRVTLFMVGLGFGRSVVWNGQARDAEGLGWPAAAAVFWPHTVFGLTVVGLLTSVSADLALWSLPFTGGLVLAIPLAIATAHPRVGGWFVRARVCATPEEVDPPLLLRELRSIKGEGR